MKVQRAKTHEEFIKDLFKINPNVEVIEKYIRNDEKIKVKCKIDNFEWFVKPNTLLNGHGCPECKKRKSRLNADEYKKKVNEMFPNIDLLSKYINSRTKITFKCKIDGYTWTILPRFIFKSKGCPVCCGLIKTHDTFVCELLQRHPNIEVLSQYTNSQDRIVCRCKIHNYIWDDVASRILHKSDCPVCSGSRINNKIYLDKVNLINKDIMILDEYTSVKIKIKCKCKIDGFEWMANPYDLLRGTGCPHCRSSKGEKRVKSCLDDNNIDYIQQYRIDGCKNTYPLPFDFYLPQQNICIEYDGIQHFKPVRFCGCSEESAILTFNYIKNNDSIKTTYCELNNIKLIRIPYYNYNSITDILNEVLENQLLRFNYDKGEHINDK